MARKVLSNAKLFARPAKERSSRAKVSSKCCVIFQSPNCIGLQIIRCPKAHLITCRILSYSCNLTYVSQDSLSVLSLSLCCAKSMFIFDRFYSIPVLPKKSLRRCTCTWFGECTSVSSVYMCVCVCVRLSNNIAFEGIWMHLKTFENCCASQFWIHVCCSLPLPP